jgi:arylsulfatase A-like enzyme
LRQRETVIIWIQAQKILTPDKPFFIYYSVPGTHDPIRVSEEWRDNYKGKFDMGWDKLREEILARQKKLGIVPPHSQLIAKPELVPGWGTLSAGEKKVWYAAAP